MCEIAIPKRELADELIDIETASPGDAEIICDIRDRAWIEAYPNAELGITAHDIEVNAKGLHDEFVPRRIAYLQEKLSEGEREDGATFVAKVAGKVVGFVDSNIEDGKRYVSAMYVDPETQGKGIGSKLMQKALAWHGRDADIFLEVVAYNQKAINFYKKFGFEKTDAGVPEEPGRPEYMKSVPQIEMMRKAKLN